MSILAETRSGSSQDSHNNETPVIERTLDREELRAELASVTKTRKIIMSAVWVVAVGVMIYGMVNVTPFLIDHGISKYIAPGLPLMVDTALCVSLWGDRVLRKYSLRDGWLTTLRWSTGLMTLMLNCAEPFAGDPHASEWTPDWIGVGVHSCGPIMLILVTEAASSFSRKASSIIQTLAKVEGEQEAIDGERAKMFKEMDESIIKLTQERDNLRDTLETTQGSSDSQMTQVSEKHSEELERLKEESRDHIKLLTQKKNKSDSDAEIARTGSQRLANILMYPKPVTQDATLMGRSLINHFSQHVQMAPLLDGSETPSTELAKQLGERIHVFTTSDQSITILDRADPIVKKIIGDGEEIDITSIPSKVLVTLQDNDLGAELIRMVREDDAVNQEEAVSLMRAIVSGNCDALDNAFLTRIVIRVAMDTGRIKDKYGIRR